MTVRQHLAALERDHLVVSREERGRTGRPHLVYQLTDGGEERFPRRYERLAELALDEVALLDAEEIAGLSADEKKRLLLVKMAERVYREHEDRVREKDLPERVQIVTDILQRRGRLRRVDGQRERLTRSPTTTASTGASSRRHPDLCDWHVSLLGRLLGKEVRVRAVHEPRRRLLPLRGARTNDCEPQMTERNPMSDDNGEVSKAAVLAALSQIQDPDLHRDIVSLGFVPEDDINVCDGSVSVRIVLTTPACPVREEMKTQAEAAAAGAARACTHAEVKMDATVRSTGVGRGPKVDRGRAQHHRRRLQQGWRRQVHGRRQPGARAAEVRRARRSAGR